MQSTRSPKLRSGVALAGLGLTPSARAVLALRAPLFTSAKFEGMANSAPQLSEIKISGPDAVQASNARLAQLRVENSPRSNQRMETTTTLWQ
eukprot:6205686-Pleurochrysis_carterae.AAC.4